MNPFKILQIRKNIKDARQNPSKFAGEQTKEVLWAVMIVPIVISLIGLILFFIMGYTELFGSQLGFFKFLFWLGFIVSFVFFLIIRRIISSVSSVSTSTTKRVIEAVVVESKEE